MKKYDALIFDLDGTLWNACEAASIGWTEALKSLSLDKKISSKDIESICGMVYFDAINNLLGDIKLKFDVLAPIIGKYERISVEKMGGILYQGVEEGIENLAECYKLYIVSNCQDWYLDVFLDHSNLREFFVDWESHGRTKKSKGENIKSVVDRNLLKNPIYVGDTNSDFEGAEFAGIDFLYAKYGYKDLDLNPSVNTFDELVNYF